MIEDPEKRVRLHEARAKALVEEAQIYLPILENRLVVAKRIAAQHYKISSLRKCRVAWGRGTGDIPDIGPVECIVELESEIAWCQLLLREGVPSWAEIQDAKIEEAARRMATSS